MFYMFDDKSSGSGILGLPYAYAKTGWTLGTIFLIIGAITSTFSLHLLSKCASKVPKYVFYFNSFVFILVVLSFFIHLLSKC